MKLTKVEIRNYRSLFSEDGQPFVLELSDGSRYVLTITCSGRPDREVTLRPPEPQARRQRASSAPYPRRRAPRAAVGPCGCECCRGGFCGGCGHAGCGRR